MLKKFLNLIFKKPNVKQTDNETYKMSVITVDRKDIMSFKETYALTNMPIMTFYQGDKKFNFIFDSGSTNCVIDSNILSEINHNPSNEVSNLFGMEGQTKQVKSCEITLYFNDRGYTYNYLITDLQSAFQQIKDSTGATLHGIIGTDFFTEFKYVLDFDELIAYSKKSIKIK